MVRQIVNIMLKLLTLWRSNDVKTYLGGIIITADPFAIHLKRETADMRFPFRFDLQFIPGIGFYTSHSGTCHTTSGNADIFQYTFASQNFGNAHVSHTSIPWASPAVPHAFIVIYLHNLVKKYYNGKMINARRYSLVCVLALVLSGCASAPRIEKPQFTQWHYTFSVLLSPERPNDSPQLELAMALLQMEYPAEQADYLNEVLYSAASLNAYKDRIINEQRSNYRRGATEAARSAGENPADYKGYNWRYAETVTAKRAQGQGITIERTFEIYSGGAHPVWTRRYYNIDLSSEYKQLRIDDFFASYQEDRRLRDVIYEELRKYSKLERGQPLSQGIYFNNEPELTFHFFIADEGLGLHWDPYQIAPYSQGNIEIILPWHAIRPLMLYPGIELLTKFNIYLFM